MSTGTYQFTLNATLSNPSTSSTGQYQFTFNPSIGPITQNNLGADAGILTVGNTAVPIPIENVTTNGFLFLQNLGAVTVDFGPGTGNFTPFGRLKAGEAAVLRVQPTGLTIGFRTTSGSTQVSYTLQSD